MIILRMFSKKESDKKKSSALGASLGIAGVGTGGAFLGKHLLDKKEKKTNKKNLEGIESKFKADQRDLVKRRREQIEGVKDNINRDLDRINYQGKTEKEWWDKMVNSPNPIKTQESSMRISNQESVFRNGAKHTAGYDTTVQYIGDNTNRRKPTFKAVGENEAREAVNNSKKDFIKVKKLQALNENDILKQKRETDILSEKNRLTKSLKKNKKLRNAALIGTGIAATGTYGILKHRENKRKKEQK